MKAVRNLLAGIAIFSAVSVVAQEAPKKTPEQHANEMTDRMKTELALSEDQTKKVQDINLRFTAKQAEIRNNSSLTKEQKQQEMKAAKDAHKEQLKNVLTEEQMKKWHEAKKEHREEHKLYKEPKQPVKSE